MNRLKDIFKEIDTPFLAVCATCSAISVFSMYAIYNHMSIMSSSRQIVVQLIASLLGIVMAVLISFVDYKELCEKWKLHSAFSYALMVLCFFIGYRPEGTTNRAWIELPLGLSIQPSEVLKISTILTLAYFLEKYRNNINEIKTLRKLIFIALVPVAAVAIQKDGGTLLIYIAMIACMFFAAGISSKLIFAAIGGAVVASPLIWFKGLDTYQQNRVLALFNPDEYASIMWQQNMGRISIGSGRILGKGFLVDNHNSTPLAYNDFIFSFVAESVGFIGTLAVLGLILFIWIRILSIARRSSDGRGIFICVGVFGMLMAQTVINIGMNLTLLPVIGVTLPLFSAGGTSVIMVYCAIGLVLGVARHNPKSIFDGRKQ